MISNSLRSAGKWHTWQVPTVSRGTAILDYPNLGVHLFYENQTQSMEVEL